MDGGLLIATQLSSLCPLSQATSVPIQTSRQNAPLPPAPAESDPPPEHASYSVTLHTHITGTILLRVLHGGLILELASLSSEITPIRFIFPAAVVSGPAIFLWEGTELHVLAVTNLGSLYRLVLPVRNGRQLWQEQFGSNWCREYLIKNVQETVLGPVQVQGTHCVAIGLPNGSLLRLEAEFLGDDHNQDEWTETVFQQGSFLSSLTSFLPTLNAGPSNGSEIVSLASHPWPTDITHIWSLSRDRTLRLWKAKAGCVSVKTIPSSISGRALTSTPGSAETPKPQVLLEAEHQSLLRVFSDASGDSERTFALAFIPSPTSADSGGCFKLFSTIADQLHEVGALDCSKWSAHCHMQDFLVSKGLLYVLWDHQGRSVVDRAELVPNSLSRNGTEPPLWRKASYSFEPELTPAYLDELLLTPGSLTAKFTEAIMRPGVFSALTLRTAIDQYSDSCLSLPGPPPSQLTSTYSTLGENIVAVVGCTVTLVNDPHTGAPQHGKYWNALKRDWEGFIARCREVERSARWPLALCADEKHGVIVIERERIGSLENEDLPLSFYRTLATGNPGLSPQYMLLEILWTLRSKLGQQFVLNLESRLVDIMHQEVAFSFVDILQDQARRAKFRDQLDEGLESWILGRLENVEDIDVAVRLALDVIGGFDMDVKREEEEDGLLLPPLQSEFSRALTASYIAITIHARYELCLCLAVLLFFLADDLPNWDPSLIAETFAVFRGIAMLQHVAQQPGPETTSQAVAVDNTADSVLDRLRNLQVSRPRVRFAPIHSVIHRLLAQSGQNFNLPGGAHRFLDGTGLLQSSSPAHTTKYEVLFCERLRLLGFYHVARELLAWLPRTAGVIYVLGRLWLNLGRPTDAASLLEKLAPSFGKDSALHVDDQEALLSVLPGSELIDSEYSFYLHASGLFKANSLIQQEVVFAQLALSVAPNNLDTSPLWLNVIKGYTDLGLFEDAYAALIASPYEKQKRDSVALLVYRMCEEDAVDKLMSFNFAGLVDEVEEALSFKARNVDPDIRPFYSRVLYAWYVFRGDHRNAALTMYQRARKLRELTVDPLSYVLSAEEQLEAYSLAINSLSLLEQKSTWIVVPVTHTDGHEVRKRRKVSNRIPGSQYTVGKQDVEILNLSDIQFEYSLLSARVNLVRKHPTALALGEYMLPPPSLVLRLAQSNRFNIALATARSLDVDMTDLFAHLTGQCLRLARSPEPVIQEDTSDWLITDQVSSWSGTHADRGWRYLRQSLARHDGVDTDFKYTKVTLETILAFDRSASPPPWLIRILEEHHHESLIRISLRYELIEAALEHTLSMIRKADAQLTRDPPRGASATWLPYTLIDQVLAAAAVQDTLSSRAEVLRQEIQTEVRNRPKRMQKLSQFT